MNDHFKATMGDDWQKVEGSSALHTGGDAETFSQGSASIMAVGVASMFGMGAVDITSVGTLQCMGYADATYGSLGITTVGGGAALTLSADGVTDIGGTGGVHIGSVGNIGLKCGAASAVPGGLAAGSNIVLFPAGIMLQTIGVITLSDSTDPLAVGVKSLTV